MSDHDPDSEPGIRERTEKDLDDMLGPQDHARRYAASDEPEDDPEALQAEQHREAEEIRGVPVLPFLTGPMWTGLVGGAAMGAFVGALVGIALSLVPVGGYTHLSRLVVLVSVCVVAGATAGAVYFGGRVPELSGESLDADGTPSSGSSLADPRTDDKGR